MGRFKIVKPRESVNLITDPSFEKDGSEWTTNNSTLLQITGHCRFGFRSGYVILGVGSTINDGIYMDVSSLDTSQLYTFSAWILTTNGANFNSDLGVHAFTTAWSHSSGFDYHPLTSDLDSKWVRVSFTFYPPATTTRFFVGQWGNDGGTGGTFFVDGVMLEQQSSVSTYFDGDMPGCKWTGAEGLSTSIYNGQLRTTGEILDLEDDLGLLVEYIVGAGSPEVENEYESAANRNELVFKFAKVGISQLRLQTTLTDSTLNDYHASRRELLEIFGTPRNPSPTRIIYTDDAGHYRENFFRYASGLDMQLGSGFSERIQIILESDRPYWTDGGYSLAADAKGTTIEAQSSEGLLRRRNMWEDGGDEPLKRFFADGVSTTMSGVHRILHDPRTGYVYVGGWFTGWYAGTLSNQDYIAKFNLNTQAWENMEASGAPHLNGVVQDMCLNPEGGIIIVGYFTNADGDSAADYIVLFDETSGFSPIDASPPGWGGSAPLRCVAVAPNGDVYVGGEAVNGTTDDASAVGLARYSRSTNAWEQIDSLTLDRTTPWRMQFAPNGDLYVVGNVTETIDSTTNYNVYKIAGLFDDTVTSTKESLGGYGYGGASSSLYALFVEDNNNVWVGGNMTDGTVNEGNLAVWNGSSWKGFDFGSTSAYIRDIRKVNGEIVVAGDFGTVDGREVRGIVAGKSGPPWRKPDFWLDGVVAGGGNLLLAMEAVDDEIWMGFDDGFLTGEVTSSQVIDVSETILGNAPSPVKVRTFFEADTGGNDVFLWTLRNESNGAQISFDKRVHLGEKITINTDPRNIGMHSDVFGSGFWVDPGSSFTDFHVEPDRDTKLTWAMRADDYSADLTITTEFFFEKRYWGID